MKFLFDQNISFRLVKKIQDLFPNSVQVREIKMEDQPDLSVWKFAKENQFTIITFDSDYADLAAFYGAPPKIIWLRTGNMTTDNLEILLRRSSEKIKDFIQNDENKNISCLEIVE